MQIVELKVQVEKSQLASLEAQVKALQSKTITIKVNTTGADAKTLNALANYNKALAQNQKAKAGVIKANAALVKENNRLAVEQQKTTRALAGTEKAANGSIQAMQKTRQEIQKTQREQIKYNRTMAQGARQQAQNARSVSSAASGYQNATKQVSAFQRVMGMSLKQTVGQMAAWTALSAAINAPIRAMKYAIGTMKEVDSQLVQIQKVTNFSTRQMKEIEEQAYSTASKYGQSADTYLEAVAAFSRAGYKEQAKDLGELAVKTMLVGDTTAEVADQFLLSVDKAYKYNGEIQKLSQVLDGADYLNNNYATSLEKIAEGMGIVAPVAAQAHVGVDELMASIGTITAVTQRSGSEAARALRALFLNIIGDTKTEIDEGVTWTTGEIKGLRDILKKYAPEIVAEAEKAKEVINPMEAIGALSEAMKDGTLKEQELMEMVSDIGGKLRTSQLLAIIQNWDMYSQMLEDYKHAAGTADKEIGYIVDSWEGRLNILKNTWTEFVSHMVDSDTFKGAISGLTGVVKFLDSDLGQAAVKAAAFAAAFAGIGKVVTAIAASGAIAKIVELFQMFSTFGIVETLGALGASLGPIALAIAAIAAVVAAPKVIDFFTTDFEEQGQKVSELKDEYEELYGLESEYHDLVAKRDGGGGLSPWEQARLDYLEQYRKELEETIEAEKQLAKKKYQEEYGTGRHDNAPMEDRPTGTRTRDRNAPTQDVSDLRRMKDAFSDLNEEFKSGKTSENEYKEGIQSILDTYADFYKATQEGLEGGWLDYSDLTEAQKAILALYDDLQLLLGLNGEDLRINMALEEIQQSGKGMTEFANQTVIDGKRVREALENAGVGADKIKETLANLRATGAIVIDVESDGTETTLENLESLGVAVQDSDGWKINIDGLNDLADSLGLSTQETAELVASLQQIDGVDITGAEGEILSLGEALSNVELKSPLDLMVQATDEATPTIQTVESEAQSVDDSDPNVELSATDNATPTISGAASQARLFGDMRPRPTISVNDMASGVLSKIQGLIAGIKDKTVTITTTHVNSYTGTDTKDYHGHATGTLNFQGGPTLLGDELSSDGSPRPELVITPTGKSFLAGTTGPVATVLPAGSRIFKYSDTVDIFSGRDVEQIPAYAGGDGRGGMTLVQLNQLGASIRSGGGGSGSGSGGGGGSGSGGSGKGGSGGGSGGSGKGGSGSGGSGGSGKGGSSSSDKDAYLESLEDQLDVLRAQYEFLEASDAETGDLIAKSQEIQAHLHTINEYLRSTGKNEKDVWKNSADWWKELKEIQELQKKVFEDEQGLLESQLKLLEHHDYTYGDQIDKHKQIQDSLHREAEYLRSIGAEQEEINKLSLKWWETQEDILKVQESLWDELDNAVQNELKKAQEARDDEVAAIDAELKRMQDERDLQQEQVDLEEKRKKVEEARFALENAQMERNVRFYNSATGQWEWGANRSDVESAQKSLEDAEKELKDAEADLAYDEAVKAMERRKEAINAAYDTLEASWKKITDSLQEPSREISVILADIAKHGTPEMKRQIDNVTQMLARLGNFVVGAIDPTTGESYVGGGGTPSMDFSSDTTDYNWLMMNSTSEAEFQHWASLRDAKMKAKGIVPGVSTYGNGSVYETNADLYSAWKSGNYDLTQKSYYGYTTTAQAAAAEKAAEEAAAAAAEASRQSAAKSLAEAARSLAESTNSNNLRDSRKAHSKSEEGAAAAAKALSERYRAAAAGTYDSGGVLYGLGGIKATSRNEVVIPPDVADYMLRPSANATFRRRMSELGYLYGATDRLPIGAQGAVSGGRSSSDHYGDVYKFGNVTLSEKQARSTTVYELAQMSRSLGIYNHA